MNLFHSAALRLTLWYLTIIMALSIGTSIVIYRLSSDQLIENTRRQVYFFNNELSPNDFNIFSRLRHRQLDEGLGKLKSNLIAFNLFVFAAGGVASYGLARRTLQPIEDTLEAQGRFTADASHELRTPLAVMQAEIEVALRNSGLSKQAARAVLASNLEEVEKLRALADGLLRLASVDNGQRLSQTVSLKNVLEQATDKWRKAAGQKKITLKTEINNVQVRGDHEGLADLVSILLDNAIKYSSAGSTVSLAAKKHDKQAMIVVTDQGPGIKASDMPRIFERFYQTDSSRSKSNSGGYGLGLAIAKKIAELHHGSIEVKSSLGKGSTFTVKLPVI